MGVTSVLPYELDKQPRKVGTTIINKRFREVYLNDRSDIVINGTSNMATAISTYLSEFSTAGVTHVYCEGGSDYLLTGTVTVPAHMRIEGPYPDTSQGEAAGKRAQFRAGGNSLILMSLASKSSVSGLKFHLGRSSYTGNVGVSIVGVNSNLVETCLFGNADETSTGIRGGGALYTTIRRNLYSDGWFGRAVDFLDAYSSNPGATYYGINVGWVYENIFAGRPGCVRVEGTVSVFNNDFEGGAGYTGPAIEHSCATAVGTMEISGNYMEMSAGNMYGILVGAGSVARVHNNIIFAANVGGVPVVGGYGFKASNYVAGLTLDGNGFNRLDVAVALGQTSESDGSFNIGSNEFNNCTTDFSGASVSGRDATVGATTINRLGVFAYMRAGHFVHRGALTGGAIRHQDADGLVLDLKRGNMFMLDMTTGGTLTYTNANYGQRFVLHFKQANVTLQNATWRLASGGDETPAAGKVKSFIVDYDGLVRELNP